MADKNDSNDLPVTNTPLFASGEKIAKVNVAEEIKNSFLDYSMSVIISRALPDARDGLKPSQRRILLAMHDLSLFPEPPAPQVRQNLRRHQRQLPSARRSGRFTRRWCTWRSRGPCANGSWTARATSVPSKAIRPPPCVTPRRRMTHLGAALMEDMDQDTVDFVPNYDETRTEPTVFPAAFPNLLVNGGTGIAVGMATNIAPHNLGEIIDGICAQIDDPDITVKEPDEIHQRPGFPDRLHGVRAGGHQGIFHHRPRQRQGPRQGRRRAAQGRHANRSSSRKSPTTSTARCSSSASPNW